MSEKGAGALEYLMLMGMVAALMILSLGFFYSREDIESLVGAWGEALAEQVAGERIGASGPHWAED
jgi:hypothetical protein